MSEPIPGAGDIEAPVLPGGKALTALHVGPYEEVGGVWSQVTRRASELGSTARLVAGTSTSTTPAGSLSNLSR